MKYKTKSVSRRTALTFSSLAALTLVACSGQQSTSEPNTQPTTTPPAENSPPLSESHRGSNADQFLLSDRQHHSKRPIDTANKWLRRRTIIRTDFGNRGTGEHSGTRSDARRFL